MCIYIGFACRVRYLGISRLGKARGGWSYGEDGRQCDKSILGGVGCDCGYIVIFSYFNTCCGGVF